LEDIIGTNKYVESIADVSKRVDDLSDQRAERINRLKLCEREKDAIEPAMKEANSSSRWSLEARSDRPAAPPAGV